MGAKEAAYQLKLKQRAASTQANAVAKVAATVNNAVASGEMTKAQATAAITTAQTTIAAAVKTALPNSVASVASQAAGAALAAARYAALTQCSAQPSLNLPPCFVNYRTDVPAGDVSLEAQLYHQLDKIADYLAGHLVQTAQDTVDRNGIDHVNVANATVSNPTVEALANAISIFLLNFPYSSVQSAGWKATLQNILSMPLSTWDGNAGMWKSQQGAVQVPVLMQQRGPNAWSVIPAYLPFFFWKGDISILRFVRYDKTWGIIFTDAFAELVQDAVLASYEGPADAVAIESWGPQDPDPDNFRAIDPLSDWLNDPNSMPVNFTNGLQAVGNAVYSHEAAEQNAAIVQIVGMALALATAGAGLAATGALTVANGISLVSAFDSLAGINNPVLGDILIAGKVLDVDAWVSNAGLDMNPPPDVSVPTSALTTVQAPDLTTIGTPTVSIDSSSFDTTDFSDPSLSIDDSALAGIGDATVDTSGLTGVDNSALVTPDDIASQLFIQPDVTVVDASTGVDLAADNTGAINIAAQDPSTVTSDDTATTDASADTSTADNSMQQAASGSLGSSGSFNLGNYVGAVAKIYATLSAANKAGVTNAANHPTVGSHYTLPNGYTARVNANGSTTVYDPTGKAVQTILPSGKVVAGAGQSNWLLYGALGLGALAVLTMTGKNSRT